jgi:hypothetical protein
VLHIVFLGYFALSASRTILADSAELITPTPSPTPSPTPLPTSTPTPTPNFRYIASTWYEVDPGLEYGYYFPPASGGAQLIVIRIDPSLYRFRVHYRPGVPRARAEWAAELPCARLFVNANFFTFTNEVVGLLVADGFAYGHSFAGRGGLMQVDTQGRVRVRSTITEPYAGEALLQAVQGYPMLVYNSMPVFSHQDTDVITRRTAVASDRQGRILIIVTPGLGIRLATLAHFIAHTNLDIVNAFNLDGGSSSLMQFVLSSTETLTIDSTYPVPAVLAAYSHDLQGGCPSSYHLDADVIP